MTPSSSHDVALLHAVERSVSRAIAESNNDMKTVKDSNKTLASYIGERAKSFKDLHHEVLKLIELFNSQEQDRFAITSSITAIDSQSHHSKEANRHLSSLCHEHTQGSSHDAAILHEEMHRGLVKLERSVLDDSSSKYTFQQVFRDPMIVLRVFRSNIAKIHARFERKNEELVTMIE